jgi:hypothetical protein
MIKRKENIMIKRTVVNGKEIQAERWQDPYGPVHKFYLTVGGGQPQPCKEADYHCVRILAGEQGAQGDFHLTVPVLTDCEFGIQKLGFEMPWAWNKYLEDRKGNDKKYIKYVEAEIKAYFEDFIKRIR